MRNSFSKSLLLGSFAWSSAVLAADTLPIVSRADWGAKPAIGKMQQHVPIAILVHHTGSPAKPKTDLKKKMQGLQRFSQAKEKLSDGRMKPAWPDVPYHFYIARDGKVAEGRDIEAVGDTNTGYDPTGFIQVVVEGNFETETVDNAQLSTLKQVLKHLMKTYDIKASAIHAHNEKAQTACPGKDLARHLPIIIQELN